MISKTHGALWGAGLTGYLWSGTAYLSVTHVSFLYVEDTIVSLSGHGARWQGFTDRKAKTTIAAQRWINVSIIEIEEVCIQLGLEDGRSPVATQDACVS